MFQAQHKIQSAIRVLRPCSERLTKATHSLQFSSPLLLSVKSRPVANAVPRSAYRVCPFQILTINQKYPIGLSGRIEGGCSTSISGSGGNTMKILAEIHRLKNNNSNHCDSRKRHSQNQLQLFKVPSKYQDNLDSTRCIVVPAEHQEPIWIKREM